MKRFKEREEDPRKSWKLTDEDWRNREKYNLYVEAADEMFEKTDTIHAPWILVPGNDKHYARVKVLEETIGHIEREVKRRGLSMPNT